jgi:hypothetical protein
VNNKLEATLETIGRAFVDIFKDVDKVARAAEPFVDIAFPALAPVYNASANGADAAITAAKNAVSSTNTDSENLLAIAIAVEPVLAKFAADAGLSAPKTGVVIQYADALQKVLAAL